MLQSAFPLKIGRRFSSNADMPSFLSSVENAEIGRPGARSRAPPRVVRCRPVATASLMNFSRQRRQVLAISAASAIAVFSTSSSGNHFAHQPHLQCCAAHRIMRPVIR